MPRPLSEVFAFFADAANLELLTPPTLRFTIETPLPIAMRPGALIDYRIHLHGLPMRWRTRIEEFAPERRFIDVQLRGPYKIWRHTHTFRSVPSGTAIDDHVDYALPFGPLGRLAHVLVRRELAGIFDYRARVVAQRFG